MAHKKVIFISSFHPHISRNVLAAGVLTALLKDESVCVVIAVPPYKVAYFKEQFGGERVVVEGVPTYQSTRFFSGRFFKRLAVYLFDTESARARKRYERYLTGSYIRFCFVMTLGFFGRSLFVRKVVRTADLFFSPKRIFAPLLRKHAVSVVFSTDLQNENDVSLLQDARRARIPTVGMARSWDNLSLRFLRVFPDTLVVGSEELKQEAITLHGFPPERIAVTGNPHYDRYIVGPSISRENLLLSFGLSPGKKFLLYAPVSDALIRTNDMDEHIIRLLAKLPLSVIVRFPPEKKVRLGSFTKPPHFAYDTPGAVFKSDEVGDREIRPEDDQNLINELYHADVVVTGPTSILMDAALADRPVVAVNFYPTQRHYFETVWRYQDDHIAKALQTGGIAYARSPEEMLLRVERYLANPHEDRAGRAELRRRWFSHADGASAMRLVAAVLSAVRSYTKPA
ncbi:MAG: hypothetical protein G01um101472_521 [Parcubacteria group bacterium Gr01-1014_72]|nr:MAG: hypothetical protein G01um101472_521 [Parcubacteria group bacterium Gr01-1014_72]